MGTVLTGFVGNSRERIATRERKSKFTLAVMTILLTLSIASTVGAQNSKVSFTFTLSQNSTTSAGIYRHNGQLVKTLWNNVKYTSGSHTAFWDRTNDEGNFLTDTGYVVKVVTANVNYTWEGVIGNNSDSLVGSSKIRAFERFHTMAVSGNYAYYGVGYTEGVPSCYKFDISKPNQKINILFGDYHDIDQECHYVATDGTRVYWAGFDPYNISSNFVYATNNSNDREYSFANGGNVSMTYGRTYMSAIDIYNNNNAVPTGLAVQKNGTYLFVAHANLNVINVFNKTSGAFITSYNFNKAREICVDANDNLWVIYGTNTIEKYTVNSNGTLSSSPTLSITSVTEPLAMAVSPNNSKIAILDGAASQQVKAFSNSTGKLMWTLGNAGGYINNPTVTDYKFYFNDSSTQLTKPFIAFQADSSFWVGDVGNERVQHYSASRVYINRIMCLPNSYSTVADRNDPTRVFNQFLEFQVDYSKPLQPHNGSWTLVRNWRRSIPANYYQSDMLRVFQQMITLSNGRTYAVLDKFNNGIREPEIVELPPSGNLRFTGIYLDDFAVDIINPDGSLRRLVTSRNLGDSGHFETQALLGFTIKNNPIWGTAVKTAYLPTIQASDPAFSHVGSAAVTSSGYNLVFNAEKDNTGYHLGAVKTGTKGYIWKTSKATKRSYEGPFPTDGSFDIGNNVEYPGGDVYAIEKNIFWNHHGEFWKNSQTNYWNHYLDIGLMVGQFGINNLEGEATNKEAYAQGAGNVFSSTVVKVGSNYYIYHNDESVHGGVHRWKITGLNTIQVQTMSLPMSNASNGGLVATYFNGNDLNNLKVATSKIDATVNLSSAPSQVQNSSSFSTRWTGFVKPNFTQNYTFYTNTSQGVRLWINGQLVIDRWTNSTLTAYNTSNIAMQAGVLYSVRMEINGGTATLSWSSSSQAKQIIPSTSLYPEDLPSINEGYDLMEGLGYGNVLRNNLYGWTRNSVNEISNAYDDYWHAETNVKSHVQNDPSLSLKFRRFNMAYTVTRDLNVTLNCVENWKITGGMLLEQDYPIVDNAGGSYFDVLDVNGKVISRITHESTYITQNNRPTQIKINGQNVMSVHEPYLYADLNKINQFTISVVNKMVTFTYGNYAPVTTTMLDTTANWKQPGQIRFYFWGGNYDRAIDVRGMKFIPKESTVPVVNNSGTQSFCQGSSVTLSAPSGGTYLWNTGANTQSITVNTSGNYSVTMTYASGCSLSSAITSITVKPSPRPVINVNGVGLTSNYSYGNQWYLNGIAIPGANKPTYTVLRAGVYSLSVMDTNGCSGIVTMNIPLPYKDVKISTMCMEKDIKVKWVTMESIDEFYYGVEYSEDQGLTWTHLGEITADRSNVGTEFHNYELLIPKFNSESVIYRWYSLDEQKERVQEYHVANPNCTRTQVKVYPNPFNNQLNISIDKLMAKERKLTIEIIDLHGKVVYTEDMNLEGPMTETMMIELHALDNLSAGYYQIRISTDNDVLTNEKILKSNPY
jgi:hypothetical protein